MPVPGFRPTRMPPSILIDDALRNKLLAALPESEFREIRPDLEPVELAVGDILWEAESRRRHIYFPTTAVICLLYESDSGASAEVGIAGRNSLVGVSTFMSEMSMSTRAVTYCGGEAFRMDSTAVRDKFGECGDFQDICMYYTQTFIAQVSQTAICNRLHSVDQQLCRFLLHFHDHCGPESTIHLTHEQISQALGVRRETISLAASTLQDQKAIQYTRGRIDILDRGALEASACECYRVETDHYRQVLGRYIARHS